MPPETAPAANTTEARTPTGELKPVVSTTTPATTEAKPEVTTTETKPADVKAPVETKAPEKAAETTSTDDKSLLNAGDKKEPAVGGPPEKYEFKVPEGFELDPKIAEEYSGIAKELGLTQAAAQRLMDFHTAKTTESANAPFEAYKTLRKSWQDAVKADPEIGGKLDEVRTTVARAIDGLGDAKLATEFREAMDLTGAGDNPAFVKAFYKLAQRVVEGKHVSGGGTVEVKNPAGGPRTIAQAIYPNLK